MHRTNPFRAIIVCGCALLFGRAAVHGYAVREPSVVVYPQESRRVIAHTETRPAPRWKSGQTWKIKVTQYWTGWMFDTDKSTSEKAPSEGTIDCSYAMTISARELDGVGEQAGYLFEYVPEATTRKSIGGKSFTLKLSKDSLKPSVPVASFSRGQQAPQLVELEKGRLALVSSDSSIPNDWILEAADLERNLERSNTKEQVLEVDGPTSKTQLRRESSRTENGGAIVRFGRVIIDGKSPEGRMFGRTVEQIWDPDKQWWTRHRVWLDGHLYLDAELVP